MKTKVSVIKVFLVLLTACVAFVWPRLAMVWSEGDDWQQVLPSPPANSVDIVGVESIDAFHKPPVFIQTADTRVYSSGRFHDDVTWSEAETVPLQDQSLLQEQQWYRQFIPFSLHSPGNVIALYPYETPTLSGQDGRATYYALLDDGTLWYWRSTEIGFVKGLYFVGFLNVIGLIALMISIFALKNRLVYEFNLQSSRLNAYANSGRGFVTWLMGSLLFSPLVTVMVVAVLLFLSRF